jgi:hypothetical protein
VLADYVAYLAAQRTDAAPARGALADAPVHSDAGAPQSAVRVAQLRARLGADLRRLADRLEPAQRPGAPLGMPRS